MSPCRETSLAVFPESETVFEYLCCPQSQKPQTVTSPPSNAALQSVHQHREGKVSGETWVNQLRRLQDKLRPAVLLLFRFWFLIIFKEDRHIAAGTVHAAEITDNRALSPLYCSVSVSDEGGCQTQRPNNKWLRSTHHVTCCF